MCELKQYTHKVYKSGVDEITAKHLS